MKKTIIICSLFAFILSSCCVKSEKATENSCKASTEKDSFEYVLNIPKKVKPEYVTYYKEVFEKCQAGTLQEEACIEYKLFQSLSDSTQFHIYERWINKEGQALHTQMDHFKEMMEASKSIFDKTEGKLIESYVIK